MTESFNGSLAYHTTTDTSLEPISTGDGNTVMATGGHLHDTSSIAGTMTNPPFTSINGYYKSSAGSVSGPVGGAFSGYTASNSLNLHDPDPNDWNQFNQTYMDMSEFDPTIWSQFNQRSSDVSYTVDPGNWNQFVRAYSGLSG